MATSSDFLVVGAGIFGVTTALSLRSRGYGVTLIDPGPLPYALAASTDVSKVVRMEYGSNRQYMQMVIRAIEGFHGWNELFGETLYHETGVLAATKEHMDNSEFVNDSYRMLLEEGQSPERLSGEEITRRFPAWTTGAYVDGFYNPRGGYAESGRVVGKLVEHAMANGVDVRPGQTADRLLLNGGRVEGMQTREGATFSSDHTVVAAGSWTPWLLPELQSVMKATGHPIFHLDPKDPTPFTAPEFVVFFGDTARTGWYGFPMLREGIVKISRHGVGVALHPEHDERTVYEEDFAQLRIFLEDTFPALLDAEITYTRRCLYNDTLDEHFWIDHHPEIEGLSIATGGSGHGFKFGPVLGDLIADVVEGRPNEWADLFRWRELSPDTRGEEASRYHGDAEGEA
ncbi:MAG: FAD-dependent oxidoreductase [Caldilineaceae bacterium]|nr:FAD-dependent oxidoreductase [Caldilineaceae bacterium]MDE0461965.1 FAD-dependent oxidoreductase [Caldilineaceae bacterium]